MQAASDIFSGKYDNAVEEDEEMAAHREVKRPLRMEVSRESPKNPPGAIEVTKEHQ